MSMHKTKDYTIFDPPLHQPPQSTSSSSQRPNQSWILYFFIGSIALAIVVGVFISKNNQYPVQNEGN
jgi:hypothetical protein